MKVAGDDLRENSPTIPLPPSVPSPSFASSSPRNLSPTIPAMTEEINQGYGNNIDNPPQPTPENGADQKNMLSPKPPTSIKGSLGRSPRPLGNI